MAHRRELLRPRALAVLAPTALLALAATLALFQPYLRLAREMDMAREESVVVHNAAALASYMSPAPENVYSPRPPRALWSRARLPLWERPFTRVENSLFPGFLATVFALVGIVAFARRYRTQPAANEPRLASLRRAALATLLLVALLAVLLGDVYTLRLERDTALGRSLPAPSPVTWTALGAAFAGSLALWTLLRRRWRGRPLLRWREVDPWERGLLISGAACLLLSFPLAYVPLMQVVPGMNGMRVPARFAALLAVTVVYFAARGVDVTLARLRRPAVRVLAVASFAALLAVELQARPVRWVPIPRERELPAVYHWLASRDGVGALLEVPMRAGGREAPYMYAATLHWKPIANGYSSFLPPSYQQLSAVVGRALPSAEALDLAASLGVTHLVVHGERLGPPARLRSWEEQLGGRLLLVNAAGTDRVYRLVGQPAQARPQDPR